MSNFKIPAKFLPQVNLHRVQPSCQCFLLPNKQGVKPFSVAQPYQHIEMKLELGSQLNNFVGYLLLLD
jgi:hypothetical protein